MNALSVHVSPLVFYSCNNRSHAYSSTVDTNTYLLHQFSSVKQGFSNRFPIKYRKRKPYAAPTYDRVVLQELACAVAYLERAGCNEYAEQFKKSFLTTFDTDKFKEAFAVRYKLSKDSTPEEDFKAAMLLLRNAAVRLRQQNLKYGEEAWNLLVEEVKQIVKREREIKEFSGTMLDELDDALNRVRSGDQAMIQAVLQT